MTSLLPHPSCSSSRRHAFSMLFLSFYSPFLLYSSLSQALPVSPSSPSSFSFLSSVPSSVKTAAETVSNLRQSGHTLQTTVKMSQISRKVTRDGYTLSSCRWHAHCVKPRRCVTPDLSGPCKGTANCLCLQRETQLCDKNCEECIDYPNETCVYLSDDEPEGSPNEPDGICASKNLILEGLAVERGCDSFPDSTPVPEDRY